MPYFGEYNCKIDSKGRLRLPAQLIRQMQGSNVFEFVVQRGFEKCLMLYEKPVWDEEVKRIESMNVFNKKERQFMRYFFRGATAIAMDSADRINLSNSQLDFAGIKKEVILTPLHDRIEIWSPDAYEKMMQEEPAYIADMAEELLGKPGGEKSSDE